MTVFEFGTRRPGRFFLPPKNLARHMISAAHPEGKGRLIAMNLTIFNEKWQSILQNLSAAGSLELFVQNHQVGLGYLFWG